MIERAEKPTGLAQLQVTDDTVSVLIKSIDEVEGRAAVSNSVSLFRREVAETITNLTRSSIGSAIPNDKISAIRVACEVLARHLLTAAPSAGKTEDLKRAARDAVTALSSAQIPAI